MRASLLIVLALIAFGLQAKAQEMTMPDHPYRVVGYYAGWSVYRDYAVADIPAEQLTHINYSFANISEEGEIVVGDPWADTDMPDPDDDTDAVLQGNFRQLMLLKEAYPHLQTLIAVGGWTWSGRFSDVALTDESRQKFARSAVNFMVAYGFDGGDIDWEYPTGGGDADNIRRPEDPENFVLLLQQLRDQLDARGQADDRHYLLTIASGAGGPTYEPLDWARIHPLLDWINVMTYDMAGPWNSVTGLHAPLYPTSENPPEGTSVDTAMQGYLALGVPADKLVMGVPFYGRGFANVSPHNNGLHQPFNGLPAGTREAGTYDYADLTAHYVTEATRQWHETALVPWFYDPETRVMISYDDAQSLALKAEYIVDNGMGGIMIWELSTDDGTLLQAIDNALSDR